MSSREDTLLGWVDARISEMLAAPCMWGSREAVELQTLLLFELRSLLLRPRQDHKDPRRVLELYQSYLRENFPKHAVASLFELTRGADDRTFSALLDGFRRKLEASTLEGH